MKPYVVVASHRRSGTHLTIDTITNNFPIFYSERGKYPLVLDHLSGYIKTNLNLDEVKAKLESGPTVLKTHSHGKIRDFFQIKNDFKEFSDILNKSRIIYVYRDGRDVLTSLYYYHYYPRKGRKGMNKVTFGEFIRMMNDYDACTYENDMDRSSYWSFHIKSWLAWKSILTLSYKELIYDYEKTISKISKYIHQKPSNDICDVRVKAKNNIGSLLHKLQKRLPKNLQNKRYTSTLFRRGRTGDWKSLFKDEDIELFNKIAGDTNRQLGYR
ncbi:MAG: sulfotransferase domain-containing protein [Planctomycetes bacterium]|nr:sulfotransferase domain-containing protein [Planctomycetota bacterium]